MSDSGNRKFLTIMLLTNILVYLSGRATKGVNKINFPINENLPALNLPVKSIFEWNKNNLIKGVSISIQNKKGNLIVPSAKLFSRNKLSNDFVVEATIQVQNEYLPIISSSIKENNFFYIGPIQNSKKRSQNETYPKEIFL